MEAYFCITDVKNFTLHFKLCVLRSTIRSENRLSNNVMMLMGNKDNLNSGYILYCDSFPDKKNALHKKSPRGSMRWILDNDLLFVKWKDTREVSFCTNVYPVYTWDTALCRMITGDEKLQ